MDSLLRSDAGEARPRGPLVWREHSTTEPLRSLNLNVNYGTVMKYTCTYQISDKTEIFKNFYSMHFYLDLLLVK